MQTPSREPLPTFGPPRDRRRRKRIFTLRNVAKGSLIVAILFAALSVVSELYKPDPGEHGRLYRERAKAMPVVKEAPAVPVVRATPLTGASAADPRLLDAARRAQYLGVDEPVSLAEPADGSAIVPEGRSLPKLGGGVFKDGAADERVFVNPPARPQQSSKRRIVISGDSQGVELRVD